MAPTVEYMRSVLAYDAVTGVITWIVAPSKNVKAGTVAGSNDSRGYKQIRIHGKKELSHRVAWALTYGVWPDQMVDHVNQNKSDNRLVNLRAATPSENRYNMMKYKNNTSGFKGVSFNRKAGKWRAFISFEGVKKYLGEFHTKDEAIVVRARASAQHHGEFARVQ